MVRFFATHPTAANILMLVIVLMGIAALPGLNKETFPEIATNQVKVSVAYPGASALEVEEGICNRLEDSTDGISYLDERICQARDNMGVMTLKMQESGNFGQFLEDIKTAVDAITDFPQASEDPVVEEIGRTKPVVSIAVTANLSRAELKALGEYYRERLLALPEVPIVNISGFSTHEYRVEVASETLRRYKLSIQDIARLIGQQSVDLPAGVLESEQKTYQIRVENQRRSEAELADLVILYDQKGGQLKLGDIATISDHFTDEDMHVQLDGKPAVLLSIRKNTQDDTLTIYNAIKAFIADENQKLPASTRLVITQDSASIVQDRLNLLLKNGWQGLVLASLALFLFFTWRYTFWVALGLPVSFIGGLVVMHQLGISINMISMVALLMAIGILMDDAIVISESIEHEFKQGKSPAQAAIDGVKRVGRGVISSYLTSAMLFGSLLFLKGDMGQIMSVLPKVLLSVLTISLIEAFLVLPHHLKHSLEKHREEKRHNWRLKIDSGFERLTERVGAMADKAIEYRYLTVGIVIGWLVLSISLFPAGFIKFKAFPDIEGNLLEAKLIMPQGTPYEQTAKVVNQLVDSLRDAVAQLPEEPEGELVKHVQVTYGTNTDAGEEGAHLATISIDLLNAEVRQTSLHELRRLWRQSTPSIPDAISIQFKEPVIGPAGKAISIRLQHQDLKVLSKASWELQSWLSGYPGVSNIMDDLRPGKPQFVVNLKPGALYSGMNAEQMAQQLRAAYHGVKVSEIYNGAEAYEVNVQLATQGNRALQDFESLPLINQQGVDIPLSAIATLEQKRDFSKITRVDYRRTVTVSGDIDPEISNTNEIISHTRKNFLEKLQNRYPGLVISLEGEVKNANETNLSVVMGFVLGVFGVFFLLSFQFRNYREPWIVLMNIPLALIGVIWGHKLMGLDITLPSTIGFVSLAGIVVNDSILLVEFVKRRSEQGLTLHDAAGQAVRDRFRAIFLTSITTVAGTMPLLSETSLQAQVLVPIVCSVVFGMIASTFLLVLVLPAAYSILEDFGWREISDDKKGGMEPER